MNARITVSLAEDLLAAVNAAVAGGRAASVSAYVAEALREKTARESLDHLLAEVRDEMGPATAEETAWAREMLGIADG